MSVWTDCYIHVPISSSLLWCPTVRCGFDAWSYTLGLHWSWGKNYRRLLSRFSPGTTSSTCYQKSGTRRLFYFSAGQCASPQSQRNHRNVKRDTSYFIPPILWLPNSPHLNPVDYKIWSLMQEQVYHTSILDVNDIKQRLLDVWAPLDPWIIDNNFVNLNFGR